MLMINGKIASFYTGEIAVPWFSDDCLVSTELDLTQFSTVGDDNVVVDMYVYM